jgi:hemerythrin superfamily protein
MEKRLTYLLTAHAVAEENVIYPALTRFGMTDASNRLYMEQAHAKVGNADLVMSPTDNDQWREEVATLRTAILHHAKDEEEADIFPRLMQAAGPMNGQLTMLYAQQFATVQRAA